MTPDLYGVDDGPLWMSEDEAESRNVPNERDILNEHTTMSYLLFCYSGGLLCVN